MLISWKNWEQNGQNIKTRWKVRKVSFIRISSDMNMDNQPSNGTGDCTKGVWSTTNTCHDLGKSITMEWTKDATIAWRTLGMLPTASQKTVTLRFSKAGRILQVTEQTCYLTPKKEPWPSTMMVRGHMDACCLDEESCFKSLWISKICNIS